MNEFSYKNYMFNISKLCNYNLHDTRSFVEHNRNANKKHKKKTKRKK